MESAALTSVSRLASTSTVASSQDALSKQPGSLDRRICVAPMMDYTDRHFRYLLRLLSPGALLYTEMVNAQAIARGDVDRLLSFDGREHPVALQLGGSDPMLLAKAARVGADFGYDEINLNCGCPSDRVRSGQFGACLMAEPQRVADCVSAMTEAVKIPITVKCRIGIEPCAPGDDYEHLCQFVSSVAKAGCGVFIVHARKAVLGGLSPKENREIPPLNYDVVGRLKRDFPDLALVLNGGIRSVREVEQHLASFDGVMLGREIVNRPILLAELHRAVCDSTYAIPDRASVVRSFREYASNRVASGDKLAQVIRHVLGLYAGEPGARAWRRYISERAYLASATADLLADSLQVFSARSAA